MTPEQIAEALERLEAMAVDFGETWDLSDNDRVAIGYGAKALREWVPREDRENGRKATIQAEALRRAAYLHDCESVDCAYCMNLKLEARDKDTLAVRLLKLEDTPDGNRAH